MATRPRAAHALEDRDIARRIGTRIREARHAAGLTQQQLAAGRYTKAYVSALEHGQAKPSMAALHFFAERLGMPAARFLDEQPTGWTRLAADLELAAGRWPQAVDAYEALLEAECPPGIRAELLLGLAEGLAGLDRGAEATRAAAEAAQQFARLGREADEALANYWLSCGEYQQGNTREARAILDGILARVRTGLQVEPDFRLRLLMALSSNASRDGDHTVALAYLEEIRGLSAGLDDRRRGVYLFDLAFSYRNTGDYEAAIRTGTAGLALLRAAQAEFEAASLQRDLALSYLAIGNPAKARESIQAAREVFERLSDRRWLAYVADTEARVSLAEGDQERAARQAEQALALAEETSNDFAALGALLTLARLNGAQGQEDAALVLYARAADVARREGKPARVREVLGEYAEALAARGNHELAYAVAREAMKAG